MCEQGMLNLPLSSCHYFSNTINERASQTLFLYHFSHLLRSVFHSSSITNKFGKILKLIPYLENVQLAAISLVFFPGILSLHFDKELGEKSKSAPYMDSFFMGWFMDVQVDSCALVKPPLNL